MDLEARGVEPRLPKLDKGGLLVLHDALTRRAWKGISRVVDDELMRRPDLRLHSSLNTTVAFEKTRD